MQDTYVITYDMNLVTIQGGPVVLSMVIRWVVGSSSTASPTVK